MTTDAAGAVRFTGLLGEYKLTWRDASRHSAVTEKPAATIDVKL